MKGSLLAKYTMEHSDEVKNYLRLLGYLKLYWRRLFAAVVCSSFVAAFTGAYAYLARPVLDNIFINKDTELKYNNEIKIALNFNKNLLLENFIIPNRLQFPFFRNILENYFN